MKDEGEQEEDSLSWIHGKEKDEEKRKGERKPNVKKTKGNEPINCLSGHRVIMFPRPV